MKVIGLMSGTSCDGLDIAYCEFKYNNTWDFAIHKAITIPYPQEILQLIADCQSCNAIKLTEHNKIYGKYLGNAVNKFIIQNELKPELIASHGHTIFHEPDKGVNLQLGDGNLIASITGIPTVFDFRSLDIALGGQGAPLVPIGDKLLFPEYDYCINIGGFSNISFDLKGTRIAFDICPANIIFNHYSQQAGNEYDDAGEMGAAGKLNDEMVHELNKLDYYAQPFPKSLGKEWLDLYFLPICLKYKAHPKDILRPLYEHVAIQITNIINRSTNSKVLITGGGALNNFLIQLISEKTTNKVVVPNKLIVDYKEALIFAFLGELRYNNRINCLASVTGASKDSSCGVIAFA